MYSGCALVTVVVTPSARTVRAYTLVLFRSTYQKGTCATILLGETEAIGTGMPSMKTCTFPKFDDRGLVALTVGALTDWSARLEPLISTSIPGAAVAAVPDVK